MVYLDFIKFTIEKIDAHTQMPNLLKSFPVTELASVFKFKLRDIK